MTMSYEDGEAPWSEDEQFELRAKACKARCKQYGYTCGQGGEEDYDFEGECDECDNDAQAHLGRKYAAQPGDNPTACGTEALSTASLHPSPPKSNQSEGA